MAPPDGKPDVRIQWLSEQTKDRIKSVIHFIPFTLRRITAHKRQWPDFLLIGAHKSGTTSFFEYLIQHPDIFPPFTKEISFFDFNRDRHLSWYRAHFPLIYIGETTAITGEATTNYIFWPDTAKAISNFSPRLKLIVLLRNPVDRAISHYWHNVRRGREKLPMMKAFKNESERIPFHSSEENKIQYDRAQQYALFHYSYIKRGMYAEQLKRFLRFFSREQLLVLQSETLFLQPVKLIKETFAFLGVDFGYIPDDLTPRRVGNSEKEEDREARNYLRSIFHPANQELFNLLDTRFDWD